MIGIRTRGVALTLAIAVAWLVPLAWLWWMPQRPGGDAAPQLSLVPAAMHSLLLSLTSATAACLLGFILARLLEAVSARWRIWWMAVFSLPLLLPAYLLAISWAPILSPSGMVVLPVTAAPAFSARAFFAAAWIQCCAWYPVALLIFHAAARQWSSKFDEACRACGIHAAAAARLRLRWHTWPALAAFAIVSLLVLADFAVADYFGVRTLGTEIFAIVAAYIDPAAALAASRPLFAFSVMWIALLGIAAHRVRRMSLSAVLPGESPDTSRASVIALVAIAACVLVVPIVTLFTTLLGGSTPVGKLLWRAMTLALHDISSGLLVATVAGLLASGAALLCAQAAAAPGRQSNAPRFVSVLALATPMTIWAIGASTTVTAMSAGRAWLMFAMLVGMALHVLAPAAEILVAGLRHVPPAHVEAARASGLGFATTWWRVLLPQIRVPLLLSFCLAWLWSLNEVTLPVLLAPPGFSTLMLRIFQTVHYGPPELLAAYTLLHVLVIGLALGGLALALRWLRRPA